MAQDYGFTSADIASISSAREGLVDGFMRLGKQIETDITRITTLRQLKSFGQELSALNPEDDAFPQRLVQTMAKYPLAANSPMGQNGINLLGARYKANQQLKTGGVLGQFIETVDDQGNPVRALVDRRSGSTIGKFGIPPKPVAGRVIDTEDGLKLVDPYKGETIKELGQKRVTKRVDPELKLQLDAIDKDVAFNAKERERLKKESEGLSMFKRPNEAQAAQQAKVAADLATVEARINGLRTQRQELVKDIGGEDAIPNTTEADLPLMNPADQSGPDVGPAAEMRAAPAGQSPFVPMGMPANIAAPQMTLNNGSNYVEPPTLPGAVPPPAVAGAPKLYSVQNGKIRWPKVNREAAIKQAVIDVVITPEQGQQFLQQGEAPLQ